MEIQRKGEAHFIGLYKKNQKVSKRRLIKKVKLYLGLRRKESRNICSKNITQSKLYLMDNKPKTINRIFSSTLEIS